MIGSNCDAFPGNNLDYIQEDTRALFDALTDIARGGCQVQSSQLLVDPDMVTMRRAIKTALTRAAEAQASLVLTFLGHGVMVGPENGTRRLFLLPRDGSETPDEDSGYEVGHRLAGVLSSQEATGLDGLLVILDVCHGGIGLLNCAQEAVASAAGSHVRLEMLSATFAQVARQGCFTKALTHAIRDGIPSLSSDFITTHEASRLVAQQCTSQEQPLMFAISRGRRVASDPGLWIARNPASLDSWPLADTHAGGLAVELTRSYHLTRAVTRTLASAASSPVTFVHGPAGSGKSALVAALSRPSTAPRLIPAGYLSATAFVALAPTIDDLAHALHVQLVRREEFRDASQRHTQSFQFQRELDIQTPFQRLVLGPLAHLRLDETEQVRIAIDAVDQLPPSSRDELVRAVTQFAAGQPDEWPVRFLITSREELPSALLGPSARTSTVGLTRPTRAQVERFLTDDHLATTALDLIADQAQSWLDVIVLYEALAALDPDQLVEARSLDHHYEAVLGPVIDDLEVRAVITVLATAGPGPVMPTAVLTGASARIGGPTVPGVVRDIVAQLGRWLSRSKPGTEEERLGVCHESLVDWLRHRDRVGGELPLAHEAVIEHVRAATDDASVTYRRHFEAEHHWQRGWYAEAVALVIEQCGSRPIDNMALLSRWGDRAVAALGAEDSATLLLHFELARWTGRSGALREAISLCEDVTRRRTRTTGADNRETLRVRLLLAAFTGLAGDTATALSFTKDVHVACVAALGQDDPLTMETESYLARWTGTNDDWAKGLAMHRALLERREHVLGKNHRDTYETRGNIAHFLARLSHKADAARAYAELVVDLEKQYGTNTSETLSARLSLLRWTGESGDIGPAVRLAFELIPVMGRVLGPDDPATLDAWNFFAQYKAAGGQLEESLKAYDYLLPRYRRVLEPTASRTLYVSINRAITVARLGDVRSAITDMKATIEEYIEHLGADNDAVLWARRNHAYWVGRSGEVDDSCRLYSGLIVDITRIAGPDDRRIGDFERLIARLSETRQIRRPDSDKKERETIANARESALTVDVLLRSEGPKSRIAQYEDFSLHQVRSATITALASFGAFVVVDGFPGLVHISELSWDHVSHPSQAVTVGDKVTVVVDRLNDELRRVSFSLRRARTDPLIDFCRKHPLGSELTGTVVRVARLSADIALPSGVKGSLPAPLSGSAYVGLRVGHEVTVRVRDVDLLHRRISLSFQETGDT